MPLFPVDSSVYAAVKARMQRARELDKLKLGARKKDVEKSWWRRAAEEAGMNFIIIGLPGKLILSKRKGLPEVLFA